MKFNYKNLYKKTSEKSKVLYIDRQLLITNYLYLSVQIPVLKVIVNVLQHHST